MDLVSLLFQILELIRLLLVLLKPLLLLLSLLLTHKSSTKQNDTLISVQK